MVGVPAVLLIVCAFALSRLPAAACLTLAGLVLACSDRQHRNPFDPMVENPIDTVTALEATAGDRRVTLDWDYTYFEDLVGLRVYRRTSGSGETAVDLAPESTSYEDRDVENGTVYEYRLGLVIAGEGERDSGVLERATPGTASAWVADPGSGLVWRLAPDGRSSVFAQGRFSYLTSIAVASGDRACWVGDRRFGGLYRIDQEGELQGVPGELEGVEEFAASAEGLGWMIEADGNRVWWADLSATSDSLRMTAVDAHFEEPSALAAALDACWIVDSAEPRVLLYHRDGTKIDAWTGLDSPGAIAASPASEAGDDDGRRFPAEAWVLVGEGSRLARLEVGSEAVEIELPFSSAVALKIDAATGDCWVLGENDVASFGREGDQRVHWESLPVGEGRHLDVDPSHRQLWVTGSEGLWKVGLEGEGGTLLGGFSRPMRVLVDPGSGP